MVCNPLGEVTITRIDGATLLGTRPRVVGCNARLPTHGRHPRDPVVRLHAHDGTVGWGWSNASEEHARTLLGKKLTDVFDPRTGTLEAFLVFDFPLWDLAGRVLDQSVHAMLGDRGCDPVPIYDGSIYIDEIDPQTGEDLGLEPVLEGVRMGIDAGYRGFKVKVGRGYRWMEKQAGFERDIEVLHAIRELIGPEMKLLIDANNGHSPDEARELMRQAGDCDIHWFEEPFPEDAEECRAFRDFIREGGWQTLLADGEGSGGRDAEFTEIVRAGGIDVVQFDLRGYTLTRWLRYLPIIAETGTLAAPHNWGSHLSGFCIQQFARGCPHFATAETDPMEMPGVDSSAYRLAAGMMTVPSSPGFGLEIDSSAFMAAQDLRGGWTVTSA